MQEHAKKNKSSGPVSGNSDGKTGKRFKPPLQAKTPAENAQPISEYLQTRESPPSFADVMQPVWAIDGATAGWFVDAAINLRYDSNTDRFFKMDGTTRRILIRGEQPRTGYMDDINALEEIVVNAPSVIVKRGGKPACEFKIENHVDHSNQGSSLYLTHMLTEKGYQRKGLAERALKAAKAHFGAFRIGTDMNMLFFRPTDPHDKIRLTDDGQHFIDSMLDKGVVTLDHVFPNDHKDEFKAYLQQLNAQEKEEDEELPQAAPVQPPAS